MPDDEVPEARGARPGWTSALAALVALYSIGYIVWVAAGAGGVAARHIVARLLFLPLNATLAGLAWHAGHRPTTHARVRTAMTYIAAAFACVFVGNAVSFYVGLVAGGDPGDSWINIFYFATYALLLLGLLSFPLGRREHHENRKFLLDLAAVLLGGGIVMWYLVVQPTSVAKHLTPIGTVIAFIYPLGDVLVLFGLATYLLRRPAAARGGPRRLFILGLATYIVCDLANDVVFLEIGWFGVSWTDLTYLLAYCVLAAALARYEWPETDAPEPHHLQSFSPLPYAAIAMAYALVGIAAIRMWPAPLAVLSVGAMGVTVLVIVRQIAAVRENAELLAEGAARENEARFSALVQHSSDVIAIVDAAAVVRFVSPSVTRIFGYAPADLVGTTLAALLHPEDGPTMRSFFAAAERPGSTSPAHWRVRHRDGRWLHAETVGTNLLHEPTVRGIVLNTRDISERKVLEAQLTHQAFHDPLTGLANRLLFLDRVSHALSLGRRTARALTIVFIDLDSFKTINDSLGHTAGDRLLVTIAERLLTCVRTADTVARLGGDEFALLIEDGGDDAAAAAVAERVAAAVRHPVHLEGTDVFVTASIGLVTAADGTAADLLRNADMAMYRAKSCGKNRYARFEPEMQALALERLTLQADLRRAVTHGGEFTMLYQPIMMLQTGEVTGMEALVRWIHPQRGVLTPMQFIPLAEETGLIVSLGRWVLREACRQAQLWQARRDPNARPLTITVNVSGHQLQYEGVVDDVRAALRDSGLDPRQLVIEITESVLMQQSEVILERLRALKTIGVRLAIDDFGTGYSSLGYLQRFPIDILKIDKAFIDDIGTQGTEPALVRAIIALGDTLRLETIAEGIEFPQQLCGLQALGCAMGQGFFLARPVAVSEIDTLLAAGGDARRSGPVPTVD